MYHSSDSDSNFQKKLSDANDKLYETQLLSRIGSWDWDMQNNKVSWSKMLYELLGEPKDATPSYELAFSHVHDDDKEKYEKILTDAVANKTSYYAENRIVSKNNEILYVVARGTCILNEKGEAVRMVGTLQDVTSQKKIEFELIRQREKAIKIEKLKTSFFENVSHEIRTPANAILGFSKILEDGSYSEETKKICINQIQSGSKRLLKIISDIVDLSNLDSNSHRLDYQLYNLNAIIDEIYQEFSLSLSKSKLRLKSNKRLTDANSWIQTDKVRLHQVISNLITNAIKNTKEGLVDFGYEIKENNLEFYVKDTGIGISEEDQEIIFDRFGQVQGKKSSVRVGVGLGLPISLGIIELFGGRLWLNSKLSKGTTFYFTIPYLKAESNSKNLSESHEQKLRQVLSRDGKKDLTILIAEDDISNFYLFKIDFEERYNIIHARNGQEAVETVRNNKNIDFIIMDLRMPYMDGFEASKQIRKIDTKIPIVAFTAYMVQEELRAEVKKAGMVDILQKPAEVHETVRLVSRYCS